MRDLYTEAKVCPNSALSIYIIWLRSVLTEINVVCVSQLKRGSLSHHVIKKNLNPVVLFLTVYKIIGITYTLLKKLPQDIQKIQVIQVAITKVTVIPKGIRFRVVVIHISTIYPVTIVIHLGHTILL